MPSRRSVLSRCGLVATGVLGGCATARAEPKAVDVLLQNDDAEAWRLRVAVERDAGEAVLDVEETVPADDGEDLGTVLIEDAFEGAVDDRFTVRAWLAGEPAGTFDYEITCPEDNRFSLLAEHRPYQPDDGEPVDYVPDRCAR